MDKVFVLTHGKYSDYGIVSVFSTEERLEAFKVAFPDYNYNDTEEYQVDPFEVEVKAGYKYYRVVMERDGDSKVQPGSLRYDLGEMGVPGLVFYKGRTSKTLIMRVLARDEQHAVKIANEHRAQLIAGGEWEAL